MMMMVVMVVVIMMVMVIHPVMVMVISESGNGRQSHGRGKNDRSDDLFQHVMLFPKTVRNTERNG